MRLPFSYTWLARLMAIIAGLNAWQDAAGAEQYSFTWWIGTLGLAVAVMAILWGDEHGEQVSE